MPETTETVVPNPNPILTPERFKRWLDIVDEIRNYPLETIDQ